MIIQNRQHNYQFYPNLLVGNDHKLDKFLSKEQHSLNKILSNKRKCIRLLDASALINLFIIGFYEHVSQTLENLTRSTRYPIIKELNSSFLFIYHINIYFLSCEI